MYSQEVLAAPLAMANYTRNPPACPRRMGGFFFAFFLGTTPPHFLEQGQKSRWVVPRKKMPTKLDVPMICARSQFSWNTEHIGGCRSPPYVFLTCCSRVATRPRQPIALRPIGLPGCRLLGARGGPAGAGCSSATADRHLPAAQLKSAPGPSQSPKDAVACYCVLASIAFVRTNAKLGG